MQIGTKRLNLLIQHQFYEACSSSLNLTEPESLGQTVNMPLSRSVPLVQNQQLGQRSICLHRRCREFEPLTTHHYLPVLSAIAPERRVLPVMPGPRNWTVCPLRIILAPHPTQERPTWPKTVFRKICACCAVTPTRSPRCARSWRSTGSSFTVT